MSLCTWFLFTSTTHTFVPSRPPVMSSFFCLLRAHTCTFALTLALRLPEGRRVCVPLVVTGILLNCILVILSRGTAWLVTVAVQRRGCYKSLIWILDAESTYLLGCGVDKLSLQSSRKGPMSSADVHGPPSSCRSDFVVLVLSLLASLPLTDPQAR